MEQVNYEKLLPTEPPEGLIPYLKERGYFCMEYIIYKAAWVRDPITDINERMVECRCSGCGEVFYQPRVDAGSCSRSYSAPFGFRCHNEDVISGNTILCPCCGAEAKVYHVGHFRCDMDVCQYYPMTVHNVGGRLAVLTWRILRRLSKDGSTRYFKNMYEAYVVEDRKLVRLCGYEKYFTTISYSSEWHQKKRYQDTFGKIHSELIYPFDESVLIGTSAENCKLDRYIKTGGLVYPVTYLNLWVKHKNVENLIMQGFGKIVNSKLENLDSYYHCYMNSINEINGINLKEAKPHRMLGISKEAARVARKEKWSLDKLEFYQSVSELIGLDDVKLCNKLGFYNCKNLFRFSTNVKKIYNYINKQNEKYTTQRRATADQLYDYWNMCNELGDELDNRTMWPQNLIRAHDIATERNECRKSAEMQKLFDKRSEVLDRYIYEDDTFIIRPAHSQAELVAEGKCLHHCVGTYAERHAKGESAIFFIRFKAEPDVSYFTLELDEENLTCRQNRGRGNCSRTDEVKAFEKKWLKHIKELKKKESKKNGKRNNKCTSGAA